MEGPRAAGLYMVHHGHSAETQNCGRFQGSKWLNITGFCW